MIRALSLMAVMLSASAGIAATAARAQTDAAVTGTAEARVAETGVAETGVADTGGVAARVQLGGFAIDRTEVTIGAFREFAERTGLETIAEREGGGFEWGAGWERRPGWNFRTPFGRAGTDTEPAVHVSWAEAQAFCADAGGRLPTRQEWSLAAYTEQRAAPTDGFETGRSYVYPVGDAAEGMNNNRSAHVAVGTTRRGVNGLYDMGANAWEWLADRRGEDALTAGGSWWYGPGATRAEGMQWKPATFFAVYVGFRCVYD